MLEPRLGCQDIGVGIIVGLRYIQLVSEIQPPEVTLDSEHFSMSNMEEQTLKNVQCILLSFKIISS